MARAGWVWGGSAAAMAASAAAIAVWAFGGSGGQAATVAQPPGMYPSFRVCLLTAAHGIVGAPAAQAWAGMEDASSRAHAMVSYLPVVGPATKADALLFLGSLVVRRCDVIIATGAPEQAAVVADAARFPRVRFILPGVGVGVGVVGPAAGANVLMVSPGRSSLPSAVAAAVEADAGSLAGQRFLKESYETNKNLCGKC